MALINNITSDLLICNECGTVIPKDHKKCVNPNCPTNKPIHGEVEINRYEEWGGKLYLDLKEALTY